MTRAPHSAHKAPTLLNLVFSQGFGSRHECEGLILGGHVGIDGHVVTDPASPWMGLGLVLTVDGQAWPVVEHALIMLHKPAGFECSLKPSAWPSVMTLLPAPLRRRGVQPVGRLDQDTTGLLLLTDDGTLLHRLTSPKHHVPKVYEAAVKHALDDSQCERLRQGVALHGERDVVRADEAVAVSTHRLRLTITSGKYHQVKRMVAAAGNRVEALHRVRFGALSLPADLPAGQWRWVQPHEVWGTAAA